MMIIHNTLLPMDDTKRFTFLPKLGSFAVSVSFWLKLSDAAAAIWAPDANAVEAVEANIDHPLANTDIVLTINSSWDCELTGVGSGDLI